MIWRINSYLYNFFYIYIVYSETLFLFLFHDFMLFAKALSVGSFISLLNLLGDD